MVPRAEVVGASKSVPEKGSPRRGRVRTFRFRGLTVVHEPLAGSLTAIALHVRAGARFDGAIPGLAHMTEHMLFQGTEQMDQLALNRRAAELGGSHNATTGYESIALTIELPMIEFFGRGGRLKPSWYGDCLPGRDFPMLVDLYLQGRLPLDKFVSETIPLDGVEDAFHKMERGEVLRSVVVL